MCIVQCAWCNVHGGWWLMVALGGDGWWWLVRVVSGGWSLCVVVVVGGFGWYWW